MYVVPTNDITKEVVAAYNTKSGVPPPAAPPRDYASGTAGSEDATQASNQAPPQRGLGPVEKIVETRRQLPTNC